MPATGPRAYFGGCSRSLGVCSGDLSTSPHKSMARKWCGSGCRSRSVLSTFGKWDDLRPPIEQGHKMKRSLILTLAFVTSACGATYYIPKPSVSWPPSVTVANTPEAQACLRQVLKTHEICRGNCRMLYTQYNRHEVEQQTQQCVTACDDARDAILTTCPNNQTLAFLP
jgi:hypothetical protein